jgi:hypothetical protein
MDHADFTQELPTNYPENCDRLGDTRYQITRFKMVGFADGPPHAFLASMAAYVGLALNGK